MKKRFYSSNFTAEAVGVIISEGPWKSCTNYSNQTVNPKPAVLKSRNEISIAPDTNVIQTSLRLRLINGNIQDIPKTMKMYLTYGRNYY
jgi:hypothetical protein